MGVPKSLQIEVTQKDIECGKIGNGFICPIALALKRKYGDILVDDGVVGPLIYTIFGEYMGDRIERFVAEFDRGERVEPTNFDVDLCLDVEGE